MDITRNEHFQEVLTKSVLSWQGSLSWPFKERRRGLLAYHAQRKQHRLLLSSLLLKLTIFSVLASLSAACEAKHKNAFLENDGINVRRTMTCTSTAGDSDGSVGTCVFPYTVDGGETLMTCSGTAGGYGWCSHVQEYIYGDESWGYCTADCSDDSSCPLGTTITKFDDTDEQGKTRITFEANNLSQCKNLQEFQLIRDPAALVPNDGCGAITVALTEDIAGISYDAYLYTIKIDLATYYANYHYKNSVKIKLTATYANSDSAKTNFEPIEINNTQDQCKASDVLPSSLFQQTDGIHVRHTWTCNAVEHGYGANGICEFPYSIGDVTLTECQEKSDYGSGAGWCSWGDEQTTCVVTDSSTGVGSCTLQSNESQGTNWGYCYSEDCLEDTCSVRSLTPSSDTTEYTEVTLEANFDSKCKNLQEFQLIADPVTNSASDICGQITLELSYQSKAGISYDASTRKITVDLATFYASDSSEEFHSIELRATNAMTTDYTEFKVLRVKVIGPNCALSEVFPQTLIFPDDGINVRHTWTCTSTAGGIGGNVGTCVFPYNVDGGETLTTCSAIGTVGDYGWCSHLEEYLEGSSEWGYCTPDCSDDTCSIRSLKSNRNSNRGTKVILEANYDSECKNMQEFQLIADPVTNSASHVCGQVTLEIKNGSKRTGLSYENSTRKIKINLSTYYAAYPDETEHQINMSRSNAIFTAQKGDMQVLIIKVINCVPNSHTARDDFNYVSQFEDSSLWQTLGKIVFEENTQINENCLDQHTFTVDGNELSNYTWLSTVVNSGRPNTELQIGDHASLNFEDWPTTGKEYTIVRTMRGYQEQFILRWCQVSIGSTSALVAPTTFEATLSYAEYTITFYNYYLEPQSTCPETSIEWYPVRAHSNGIIYINSYDTSLNRYAVDSSQTATVTIDPYAIGGDEDWRIRYYLASQTILTRDDTFTITACPVLTVQSGQDAQLQADSFYLEDDTWVVDVNASSAADKQFTLEHVFSPNDRCEFSITMCDTGLSACSGSDSWWVFEPSTFTLTLTATGSDFMDWKSDLSVLRFNVSNRKTAEISKDFSFELKDCSKLVNSSPILGGPDIYVHLDTVVSYSLPSDSWTAAFPHECGPYSVGLKIDDLNGNEYYVGGSGSETQNLPGWLSNFLQDTTSTGNFIEFDIAPTQMSELAQYQCTIQIKDKDGHHHDEADVLFNLHLEICTEKTPIVDQITGWESWNNADLFDYSTSPVTITSNQMTFPEFFFTESYCQVTAYKFSCEDPSGNVYFWSTEGWDYGDANTSTACAKFDTSGIDIANGTRQVDAPDTVFNSADEGIFKIKIEAWMRISSSTISNKYSSLVFSRKITPNCFESGNQVMIGPELLSAAPAVVTIATVNLIKYADSNPFSVTYFRHCSYKLHVEDADDQEDSTIVIDESTFELSFVNVDENSDYPGDTYPQFIVPYKLVVTVTKEDGVTVDPSSQTGEIPFDVAYSLNCGYDVIQLHDATLITLDDGATSPVQGEIYWSALETVENSTIKLAKTTAIGTPDVECLLTYVLVQVGFNDTSLNPSHQSSDGYFHADYVSLDDSGDFIELTFKTQTMASTSMITYDPNAVEDIDKRCSLDDVDQTQCTQKYQIYASSQQGIVAWVHTFEMTFKDSCYFISTSYKNSAVKATYWSWADKTNYDAGYALRNPLMIVQLPTLKPYRDSSSHTDNDINVCGPVDYVMVSDDDTIFSVVKSKLTLQSDVFEFQIQTSDHNKTSHVRPYTKLYKFTSIVATFEYYPDLNFTYYGTPQFGVRDYCLGARWSRPDGFIQIYDEEEGIKLLQDPQVYSIDTRVMNEPKIVLFQLQNYILPFNEPTFLQNPDCGIYTALEYGNCCGATVWSGDWVRDEIFNEEIFGIVENSAKFNLDIAEPVAYEAMVWSNQDVRNYTYIFTVRVAAVNETSYYEEIPISLEIKHCQTELTYANNTFKQLFVYYLDQTQTSYSWKEFEQQPLCNYTWTYDVVMQEIDPNSNFVTYQSWFDFPDPKVTIDPPILQNFDNDDHILFLEAKSQDQIEKQYQIYVWGELDYHNSQTNPGQETIKQLQQYPVLVEISEPYFMKFNTAPVITTSIDGRSTSELTTQAGVDTTVNFNKPTDTESNHVSYVMDSYVVLGEHSLKYAPMVTLTDQSGSPATNFTNVQDMIFNIKIEKNIKAEDPLSDSESFTLKLKFIDDHEKAPQITSFSFKVTIKYEVIVEAENNFVFDATKYKAQINQEKDKQYLPPNMFIDAIEGSPNFKIEFDQPVLFNLKSLQNRRRRLQDEESALDGAEDLFGPFKDLNSKNEGAELFSLEYQPSQRSSTLQDTQDVEIEISWSLDVISEQEFDVVVEISNSNLVSQYQALDQISFKVLSMESFLNEGNLVAYSDDPTTKLTKIPAFPKPAIFNEAQVQSMGDAFAQSVKAAMAGNLGVTIAMATSLQYLWGMVNGLQLMVLAVFFAVDMAPNIKVIMVEILKSCSFEVVDMETFFEKFEFGESESFSEIFAEAGMDGSIFVVGLGSVVIFILLFPVYILFHKMMVHIFKGEEKINCIKNFIKPKQFFNMYMIFMLEGCIEIGMTGSVSLTMMNADRFSSFWEIFSTFLCFFFGISLLVAPVYTIVAGYKLFKAKKAKDIETIERLQPIFEGKRLKNAWAIQHSSLFFLRRLIIIAILVMLPEYRQVQILTNIMFTLLMILFIFEFKPFEEIRLNKQEIFNELMVLLSGYTMFLYTEFVPEYETKYLIGWFHVGLILVVLMGNIGIMCKLNIQECQTNCKKSAQKKRAKEHQAIVDAKAKKLEEAKKDVQNMFNAKNLWDYLSPPKEPEAPQQLQQGKLIRPIVLETFGNQQNESSDSEKSSSSVCSCSSSCNCSVKRSENESLSISSDNSGFFGAPDKEIVEDYPQRPAQQTIEAKMKKIEPEQFETLRIEPENFMTDKIVETANFGGDFFLDQQEVQEQYEVLEQIKKDILKAIDLENSNPVPQTKAQQAEQQKFEEDFENILNGINSQTDQQQDMTFQQQMKDYDDLANLEYNTNHNDQGLNYTNNINSLFYNDKKQDVSFQRGQSMSNESQIAQPLGPSREEYQGSRRETEKDDDSGVEFQPVVPKRRAGAGARLRKHFAKKKKPKQMKNAPSFFKFNPQNVNTGQAANAASEGQAAQSSQSVPVSQRILQHNDPIVSARKDNLSRRSGQSNQKLMSQRHNNISQQTAREEDYDFELQ